MLFRSQQGTLYSFDELFQRISRVAGSGIIVEFAMPKESSFDLPELKPYQEMFSQKDFEQALQHYFPQYKNLGRCDYSSGNKYGRYMYYGKKR